MDEITSITYEHDFAVLLEARGWNELTAMSKRLVMQMGIDEFMMEIRIADGIGDLQCHTISSLSTTLVEKFRLISEGKPDPITKQVISLGIPLAWEIAPLCSQEERCPYNALHQAGLQCALSISVRSERSVSRIDYYSRIRGKFALQQQRSDLLLLSCYLNEAARPLSPLQRGNTGKPVLTLREQQCLRWSALGKTGNEIGSILGISQNTVYFHLKKAAAKFQVYGTRHAVCRAMEMNLI